MTDAEIKEAIRRDKEWMNNLNPEDEIKIPEGGIKGLFGDDDDDSAGTVRQGRSDSDGDKMPQVRMLLDGAAARRAVNGLNHEIH